jgi:hypothetical protein
MKKDILKIALRQNAVFIPKKNIKEQTELNETSSALLANVLKLGFSFSEPALIAVNGILPSYKLTILEVLKEVSGANKNWTPLVKGWDIPTGETVVDHVVTFFANFLGSKNGTTLACGHLIPANTFPLERYNGCPYCGTPFEFGEIEVFGQGSKFKVLDLWTETEAEKYFVDLLTSKTALDATQADSLKTLLKYFDIPKNVEIGMKETTILVIDTLIENEKEVKTFFKNPTDILRYLWYKHTGFLQIIEPKTIIQRKSKNNAHIFTPSDESAEAKLKANAGLKLKYSRKECRRVASWLNSLELSVENSCEIMHPKRGMWVRFIRALRLAEYSKKKGFEKLANLLDVFYNQKYEVWQGRVNHFRLKQDAEKTFALLKKRPGLFARSLFSNMLWFGAETTLKHFKEVIDKIPARLIFTLNMYAQNYFSNQDRSVKPLGGTNKRIPANPLLQFFDENQLNAMKTSIEDLCIEAMKVRFAAIETENKTIFIEDGLYNIPVAIGDRSETVQDFPVALMGTRFPLEGNTVRLFMSWGEGLSAQHLDMDLSCQLAFEGNKVERCSYSNLVATACKHSGDIQSIPEKVGTAEYIDINVDELIKNEVEYVSFTCNAYSNGSISPNLVVGWMDSKFPMKISKKTGVAYDPSCVQHQVKISQTLSKGLVFGVLDVKAKEIMWLEMSFGGQVVQNLDTKGVKALLAKLDSKLNIGNLLTLKAEAQGLEVIKEKNEADEVYDMEWARNSAAVTQLLVD